LLITSLVFVIQVAPAPALKGAAEPDVPAPTLATSKVASAPVFEPEDTGWIAPEIAPQEPPPITVPKGHKILISIEGQVGSKISQRKDFFPIKLAQSVVIDGVEVLPAGLMGEGQVVHADKAGFAGSAGELILAARYLMQGARKIPLRSFKWIEEGDEFPFRGTDNSGAAIATNSVLGPLGMLIGGGNTTIEPGTVATAKFRADEEF